MYIMRYSKTASINVKNSKNLLGNPRWGYAWGVHKLPHA